MTETLLGKALEIRALENLLLELYRRDWLFGTVHTCVGQEFCATALHPHLERARDNFVGSHRGHGHYLAWGGPLEPFLAEMMGREGALCQGRGGTQHLCWQGFFTSGIQGGGSLWATGLAWARKLEGRGGIAVAQLGDGTLGQGAVYEAFTFAALWRLPVLFYLEWNDCAQSTDTATTTPGDVPQRARGFGLEVVELEDLRPEDLNLELGRAVDKVRHCQPHLVLVRTRRLLAHSKGDDPRPPQQLARLWAQDPLQKFLEGSSELQQKYKGMEARLSQLAEQIHQRPLLDDLPEEALAASLPPLSSRQLVETYPGLQVEALNAELQRQMQLHPEILLLGEDLADPYGGAFKVTRGLSSRYPDRVFSTPIAEAAIVGVANGLALAGKRPVVEIMFADFATLACDQIVNHAAKFRSMYAGQASCPLLIRLVSGGGRGYGPTHSQSLESLFFGVPGLRLVALSRRHHPGVLLSHLLEHSQDPTLLVENKRLYALPQAQGAPLDLEFHPSLSPPGQLPALAYRAQEPQVTLVTYGGALEWTEEALERLFVDHEVDCDLIVLTQLWPLKLDEVLESVERTGRLVTIEEGSAEFGVGAAMLAQLASRLSCRGLALGSRPLPIPSARQLEARCLPDAVAIVQAVLRLL